MEFKRLESATYPQIYKTFSVNGEEFYVSDLTEDYAEEALNILNKYVVTEETFCKAVKIYSKENAMKIVNENYRQLFKKRMSLACFNKETGEMVGLNILGVKSRSDTDDPVSRKWSSLMKHFSITISINRLTIQT